MKVFINTLMNTLGFLFGILFNIGLLALTLFFIYTYAIRGYEYGKTFMSSSTAEKEYKEAQVTLEEGSDIAEVARILEDEEIIPSAIFFRLEALLKRNSKPFPGGTYTVNNQMDSNELNSALRKVVVYGNDNKITIREGFSLNDIGDYLESQEILTKEEFLSACDAFVEDYSNLSKYPFLQQVPDRENKLEGYLFPDTYFITENADSDEIIRKMLNRFHDIYSTEYTMRANELGLTMDEVITMASIIEKEIRVDGEREKASQVIYNRLERGMNLQMCSTVLYVLGIRKDRIQESDLAIQSPYNTYINAGLPIGPIGNPGKSCIEAALNPSEGDLLYFVVMDESTGEHFFTGDYDAFLEAKAKYNQKY